MQKGHVSLHPDPTNCIEIPQLRKSSIIHAFRGPHALREEIMPFLSRKSQQALCLRKLSREALKAIKGQRNEILGSYACMRKMTNDSFEEQKKKIIFYNAKSIHHLSPSQVHEFTL